MYGLLIVDDDRIEREGLAHMPMWDDLGVEVVGKACNGKEALDFCASLNVQIVITDVRMPVMDGIEFSKQLGERFPQTAVIFLSGYEDVSYIRSAFSTQAFGYLLKPVNRGELLRAVDKAVNFIKQGDDIQQREHAMQKRIQKLLPLERKWYFRNWIFQIETLESGQITSIGNYLQLPLAESATVLVLAEKKTADAAEQFSAQNRAELLRMEEVLAAICADENTLEPIMTHDGEFAMVFLKPAGISEHVLMNYFEQVTARIIKALDENRMQAAIGVSGFDTPVTQMYKLYEQASQALQLKLHHGYHRVYWYAQTGEAVARGGTGFDPADGKKLLNLLLAGEPEMVKSSIEQYFEGMINNKIRLQEAQQLCFELLLSISMQMRDIGYHMEDLIGTDNLPYKRLLQLQTLPDIKNFLTNFTLYLQLEFKECNKSHNDQIVEQIKALIHDQYHKNITMETISQQMYLTSTHLRRVFKNQTGQTIQDYILDVRMKKAAELLKNPAKKVHEVALAAGFENGSYFCLAFKKYFGVTTGEYRASMPD